MPETTDATTDATTEAPLRALAALITRQDAPSLAQADLEAWLRAQGVEGDDLRAMLEVGATRMLVYRRLVHNGMRNPTAEFIPRTVARMGADRFRRDFEAFVEERGSSSRYIRDVPLEFMAWVEPRWVADPEVPAWIPELARHELLDFEVRNEPRGGEPATGLPLALDRPLRFDGAARLVEYAHAIHRLPKDKDDRSEPAVERTCLLVYRDADHKARYLALSPFADALLRQLLLAGQAVQPALLAAAASLGEPLDDDKLAAAAQLLADLAERGVCLGAAPE